MDYDIFGDYDPGKTYPTREGAYLVAVKDGMIATVCERECVHLLPGGKIEEGETPAECILRECLEETGWSVRVGELIHAVKWYAEDYCLAGQFYAGEFLEKVQEKIEPEQDLEWVPLEMAPKIFNMYFQYEGLRRCESKWKGNGDPE